MELVVLALDDPKEGQEQEIKIDKEYIAKTAMTRMRGIANFGGNTNMDVSCSGQEQGWAPESQKPDLSAKTTKSPVSSKMLPKHSCQASKKCVRKTRRQESRP